ncbi:MAG: cell wall-binding repeat-containing protein [Coriobacteriales bacterium]|jgi:N-acetylmuramoyl-L-alanine amidase
MIDCKKLSISALSTILALSFSFPVPALADDSDGTSSEESGENTSIEVIDIGDVEDEAESAQTTSSSSSVTSTQASCCEDETYVASEEEIEEALANGVEGMPSTEESNADTEGETGNMDISSSDGSISTLSTSTTSSTTYKVASFAGSDRYETATKVAKTAFGSTISSGTAILVSGENNSWADPLSASSLAGAIDCPILYTNSDSLNSTTEEYVSGAGITDVIVVGGEGAVSSDVVTSLEEMGITVTRLSGEDRIATQLAIYNYGVENDYWDDSSIIIATSKNFADALSISPIAYAEQIPIFLVGSDGSLNSDQLSTLESASSASKVIIVGGSSAVPSTVDGTSSDGYYKNLAKSLSGSSSVTVKRLSGSNRYLTSAAVAKWGVSSGYLSWNNVGFASGTSPYDALCSCSLLGKTPAPLLLISKSNTSVLSTAKGNSISRVRVFGGTSAIRPSTRNDIAYTLGFKLTTIQGFKVYVDAGHGQNNTGNGVWDSGAVGSGYYEANLTKELADKVAAYLRSDGISVFLNDDGGPYYYRHAEAVAQDCNVIVSIHFNAGGGTGSMSLIHSYNADTWSSKVQDIIHPYLIKGTGLKDRGQDEDEIAILGGELPATLLEVCFIDNSSDMSTYVSRKSTVARQIAYGIEKL